MTSRFIIIALAGAALLLIIAAVFFGEDIAVRKAVPELAAEIVDVDPVLFADNQAEGGDKATAAGLVPHKALYDIGLLETRSGSQIVNISGRMFYEWQPGCEAWNTNHRFNLLYEYADSPAMQVTSDFSTYEAFDGSALDFVSVRKRDGEVFEEIRGRAMRGERDGVPYVEVDYKRPEETTEPLPDATLFPMAHTLKVLEAIKRGDTFYKAPIFDGSDASGAVDVNVFIGKALNAMAAMDPSPDFDTRLLNVPARRVRMAFFPVGDEEAVSDYEMDVAFHQNGVISDMTIEYDDFTVSQKLVALEKLNAACGQEEAPVPAEEKQDQEQE